MVAVPSPRLYTPEEYLLLEAKAETKNEYHAGFIVAMAGASFAHSQIAYNLNTELGVQLKNSPCQGLSNDTRVWIAGCEKYYYPDSMVLCGEPEFQTIRGLSALTNPTLIVEILSETTEAADRGEKFACYRSLPSLMTYALISQDRPRVEVFRRQAEGSWLYTATETLEGVVTLESIGCTMRLADIYARVVFPLRIERTSENTEAETS